MANSVAEGKGNKRYLYNPMMFREEDFGWLTEVS